YGDLCDWYLEIVKPRLYEGEEDVSATLLYALERVLALLHPTMPFVTEEIWSFHPAREGHLTVHAFPVADAALFDDEAESDVAEGITLTRSLRAWRDLVGVPAKAVLPAVIDGMAPADFVGRLSRFAFDGVGSEPVASVGPVRVLASEELDAEAVGERLGKRREELTAEIQRAERKLGNEGFVAKAPPIVVEEERGKLERYRSELSELEGD
ncbi:MAG TPA: class I tRNA ligase family protein, partial [Solirubrobacterales bacterium]